MAQETGSLERAPLGPRFAQAKRNPEPLALSRLVASVMFIALGAVAFACLVTLVIVSILLAGHGAEWLSEYYQEIRFDFRLKTLVGALAVGTLYVGVAVATILTAALHAGSRWPSLVGWTRVGGSRRVIVAICATTVSYAVVATLALSLLRSQRIMVSGVTDLALVSTITANLVVLAPMAEELFFRGWLYTGLRARFAFWPSFFATALFFVAIHWDATHRRSLLVLPLAVALGILREVTGSIKPTIALHAIYNLIIVGITLLET